MSTGTEPGRESGGETQPPGSLDSEIPTVLAPGDSVESPPAPVLEEEPLAGVGPYLLREQIGEGGMGTVFRAEQQEPIRREVAFKLVKPGMDSRRVVARFEAERQALALMNHPNIARVLDAGTAPGGRPYFVMELVRGEPITEYCDRVRLGIRERLELFLPVCAAVQHAHQKGVIHRDLKPSNVMVTERDGRPLPVVIDFGVAKATSSRLTERTLFTHYEQLLGTPAYMSPEQADSGGVDVDTRTDIYSLGALLYELVAGAPPFELQLFKNIGPAGVLQVLQDGHRPLPSARATALGPLRAQKARDRGTDPGRLPELLAGEIDWVIMKALARDRTRRYDSADALSAELRRILRGEPVEAGPPSRLYRLKKLARRNQKTLGAALLVAAALVAGASISLWQAYRATQAKALADHTRDRGEELIKYMLANLYDQLEPIGRLGVLDVVAERVDDYYDNLPSGKRARIPLLQRCDAISKIALIQIETGNPEAAARSLQEASQALKQVLETGMKGPDIDGIQAFFFARKGRVEERLGQMKGAVSAYQTAEEFFKALPAEGDHRAPYWADERASNLVALGDLSRREGQAPLPKVLADLRQALELRKDLVRISARPDRDKYRFDLAINYHHLGLAYADRGDLAAAEDAFESALRILRALEEDDVIHPRWSEARAATGTALAGVLQRYNDLGAALAALREALAALDATAPFPPGSPAAGRRQKGRASALGRLAEIHEERGDFPQAARAYRDAIEILGAANQDWAAGREALARIERRLQDDNPRPPAPETRHRPRP